MSLTIHLTPQGTLEADLPAAEGRTRTVAIGDLATIHRILAAQLARQFEIGADGAPTERQVRHWERHGTFPDDRCPFCISAGRIAAKRQRPKATVLAEHAGVTVRRIPAKGKARGKATLTLEELGL